MRTLLVMRHGKSSWADSSLSDFDRPLKKRGRRDAPRMAAQLEAEDLVAGLIVASAAQRASSTALLVAEAWDDVCDVVQLEDLYPGTPDDYIRVLVSIDTEARCVMVVGHNPGLQELVAELTGQWTVLPTAAVAVVSLPISEWRGLQSFSEGVLDAVWRPRELTS